MNGEFGGLIRAFRGEARFNRGSTGRTSRAVKVGSSLSCRVVSTSTSKFVSFFLFLFYICWA